MNIAIIGAGNVGRALAIAASRAGHDVVVTARSEKHAAKVATEAGGRTSPSNAKAAKWADVVILATPFTSAETVASEIRGAVAGKPVVDVSNRMSMSPTGPTIDAGPSNAERLAELLPESAVIKAFNTLFASNQADPVVDGIQLDGFVAGDDPEAKSRVLALVASIGLHPIDAGPLARAQQLEQMAFLNIALNASNGWAWTSGWKLSGAPASDPRVEPADRAA